MSKIKRADELMPGNQAVGFERDDGSLSGKMRRSVATMEKNVNGFVPAFVAYNMAGVYFMNIAPSGRRRGLRPRRRNLMMEGGGVSYMQAVLFAASGDKSHAKEKMEAKL